jgi:hypothetical protein
MRRLLPLPLLLLLLLAPVGAAETSLDNLLVEVEFTPQARCVVEASACAVGEDLPPLELELGVSRSGSSSLKMEVKGSVGELPGEVENLLPYITAQQLNLFLSSYQGKRLGELMGGGSFLEMPEVEFPPEMENLVLERIEVKEFKPLHPGLRFSLLVVLGGVQGGWEYLPLSLWFSLSPSGEGINLSVRAEFSLPHQGDQVLVDLSPLSDLGGTLEGVSVGNFSLSLRLPEGASVSGLQGFENENGSYRFSGENMESFLALASSMGETSLSYPYSPPPGSSLLTVAAAGAVLLLLLGGALWILRGRALFRKGKRGR